MLVFSEIVGFAMRTAVFFFSFYLNEKVFVFQYVCSLGHWLWINIDWNLELFALL